MPMMCSSVDLPAPDGPMMDTNSPSLMSSAIRRSTQVRLAPSAYDFSRLRSEISASSRVGSRSAADDAGVALENNDMSTILSGIVARRGSPLADTVSPFTESAPLLTGRRATNLVPPRMLLLETPYGDRAFGQLAQAHRARWNGRIRGGRRGTLVGADTAGSGRGH